jgi:hypothetical protein
LGNANGRKWYWLVPCQGRCGVVKERARGGGVKEGQVVRQGVVVVGGWGSVGAALRMWLSCDSCSIYGAVYHRIWRPRASLLYVALPAVLLLLNAGRFHAQTTQWCPAGSLSIWAVLWHGTYSLLADAVVGC